MSKRWIFGFIFSFLLTGVVILTIPAQAGGRAIRVVPHTEKAWGEGIDRLPGTEHVDPLTGAWEKDPLTGAWETSPALKLREQLRQLRELETQPKAEAPLPEWTRALR